MRRILLSWMIAGAALAQASDVIGQVQSVYLLPMGSGFEQYLANRLTNAGIFQVVTDPMKADAVITDRLGEAFEAKLQELYPPPPAEEKKEEKKKEEKKDAKAEKKDDAAGLAEAMSEEPPVRRSSFARSKGTLFIVNRGSGNVVWSIYAPPKDSNHAELDKAAVRIVEQLKKDLGRK